VFLCECVLAKTKLSANYREYLLVLTTCNKAHPLTIFVFSIYTWMSSGSERITIGMNPIKTAGLPSYLLVSFCRVGRIATME
jgi:hypothetical protein